MKLKFITILFQLMLWPTAQCLVAQAQWWHEIAPNLNKNADNPEITSLYEIEIDENQLAKELSRLDNVKDNQFQSFLIPGSDQRIWRFQIRKNQVLEDSLQNRYPQIKSYEGFLENDPSTKIKMEMGPHGWHAMYRKAAKLTFVDPITEGNTRFLRVYQAKKVKAFGCEAVALEKEESPISNVLRSLPPNEPIIRTYRIAVVSLNSFTQENGSSVASTLAMITSIINRTNLFFEQDLGIRLRVINSNDKLISTDPNFEEPNDKTGYINRTIGTNSYDIGHYFLSAAGSSGFAHISGVCGNAKGHARTIMSPPFLSVPRNLNVFLHELGHQFGANHSFNGQESSCKDNREPLAAFEPGAGTTIMSYAGNCSTDDVVLGIGDNYFHGGSIAEIYRNLDAFVGTCAEEEILDGANLEIILPEENLMLPVFTPIEIEAQVNGGNPNNYLYNWEQVDVGGAAFLGEYGIGNAALFRSYPPNLSTYQSFPSVEAIINPVTNPGELLPKKERYLSFQFTVFPLNQDETTVLWERVRFRVTEAAGPFVVKDINNLSMGAYNLIEWDVAGTDLAPIEEDSVVIWLSKDDRNFDYELLTTRNDGAAWVYIPAGLDAQTVRVKVAAHRNIFYNLSKRPSIAKSPDLLSTLPFARLLNPEQNFICLSEEAEITGIINYKSISNRPLPDLSVFSNNLSASVEYIDPEIGSFNVQITNPLLLEKDTLGLAIDYEDYQDTIYFPLQSMSEDTLFQPQLQFPVAGQNEVSWTPGFSWETHPFLDSFVLEIAYDPNFEGLFYETGLKSITRHQLDDFLEPSRTYYWRVTGIDAKCGITISSPIQSFETEAVRCDQFRPAILPAPFNTEGLEESFIEVDQSLFIYDLNILDIQGTYPTTRSDIKFQLTNPLGTSIDLFHKRDTCDQSRNFHISLDDEVDAVDLPCPHDQNNSIKPLQALSSFMDEEVSGFWSLTTIGGGKAGQLDNWTLEVCYGENTLLTDVEESLIVSPNGPKVYPNPAQDYLNFEFDKSTNYHLFIHDALGRLVYQKAAIQEQIFELNISSWESGLYFYTLIDEEERRSSGKWIKR